MDHHVVVEKLCSCAKKQGMPQITSHATKEAALAAAEKQLGHMLSTFCGKHEFDIVEVEESYVIGMLGGCDCSKSKG